MRRSAMVSIERRLLRTMMTSLWCPKYVQPPAVDALSCPISVVVHRNSDQPMRLTTIDFGSHTFTHTPAHKHKHTRRPS